MNDVKGMIEIGKQRNQNEPEEPYVNHEGLKRVYNPNSNKQPKTETAQHPKHLSNKVSPKNGQQD